MKSNALQHLLTAILLFTGLNLSMAQPALRVSQNSNTLSNNSTWIFPGPVGDTVYYDLKIENSGSGMDSLKLTPSSVINGTDSAQFLLGGIANDTIALAAGEDTIWEVGFLPASIGFKSAVFNLDYRSTGMVQAFSINLEGVGDTLADEPSTTSVNASVWRNFPYELVVRVNRPASVDGLLVLKSSAPTTSSPERGQSYVRGDMIDNAKVLLNERNLSSTTDIDLGFVKEDSPYFLQFFTFNDGGDVMYRNYQDLPDTMTFRSAASNPGNFYSGIDPSDSAFVTTLKNKLSSVHVKNNYDDYYDNLVDPFYAHDTIGNQKVVYCDYSDQPSTFYTPPAGFSELGGFSREHSYPRNWMPEQGSEPLPFADYHGLYITNQNQVNGVRSNYPFGEVQSVTSSHFDGKLGKNNSGQNVYEVKPSMKGDVARALFYLISRYWGETGPNSYNSTWKLPTTISSSISYGQDEDLLRQWHYQDPPSHFEKARNSYVSLIQGNRNPYIDNPDWVCYINFTMPKHYPNPKDTTNCQTQPEDAASLKASAERLDFVVYPNPVRQESVRIIADNPAGDALQIEIYQMDGKLVYEKELPTFAGLNDMQVQLPELAEGLYLLKLQSATQVGSRKLFIQD